MSLRYEYGVKRGGLRVENGENGSHRPWRRPGEGGGAAANRPPWRDLAMFHGCSAREQNVPSARAFGLAFAGGDLSRLVLPAEGGEHLPERRTGLGDDRWSGLVRDRVLERGAQRRLG